MAGHGSSARFAQATLDQGVVVDGVLKHPAEFVTVLKRTLRSAAPHSITSRHVVVGLPETRVFTTLVQLPQVRDRELREALNWQLPTILPVPPAELVVDFQPISARQRDERQLLVMAAPLAVVAPLVETLEQADFRIDRCVPRSLGIASLFAQPAHTPLMVVDYETTDAVSLMIVKNGTARFSTTVPLEHNRSRVSTAIERAVQFYESRDGQHRRVTRVLVLPHPNADELITQLQADLKLPVQLAETPWAHTHTPRRLRAFLGSLGLLPPHGVRVNLLPPATIDARRTAVRSRWLTTAWLTQVTVAGLVITGVGLDIARQLTQATTRAATIRANPLVNESLVAQGQSLETLRRLSQAKQGLRSTRQHEYETLATAVPSGVRILVVEHDAVKQETRVIGERTDRAALARYVSALSQTMPGIRLASDDWASPANAPFHLTVKSP